jgi:hypothetical protein
MGGLVKYSRPQRVSKDLERLAKQTARRRKKLPLLTLLIGLAVLLGAAFGEVIITFASHLLTLVTG